MAAAESRASLPADSIDFVNENNSGGAALCGVEKIAHTACTDADVKLDEFGTADGEEGDFGFTGNRFCKQCFACARRADKKNTFGNSCTHFGESFRIAQKIDNLAQLLFSSSAPATSSNVTLFPSSSAVFARLLPKFMPCLLFARFIKKINAKSTPPMIR